MLVFISETARRNSFLRECLRGSQYLPSHKGMVGQNGWIDKHNWIVIEKSNARNVLLKYKIWIDQPVQVMEIFLGLKLVFWYPVVTFLPPYLVNHILRNGDRRTRGTEGDWKATRKEERKEREYWRKGECGLDKKNEFCSTVYLSCM